MNELMICQRFIVVSSHLFLFCIPLVHHIWLMSFVNPKKKPEVRWHPRASLDSKLGLRLLGQLADRPEPDQPGLDQPGLDRLVPDRLGLGLQEQALQPLAPACLLAYQQQ